MPKKRSNPRPRNTPKPKRPSVRKRTLDRLVRLVRESDAFQPGNGLRRLPGRPSAMTNAAYGDLPANESGRRSQLASPWRQAESREGTLEPLA